MIIRNKFNGYIGGNNRLYPGGGGGGPTTNYSQTSNIPEYARPYVEQMLGATQRQLFTGPDGKPNGFSEFMPYGATYEKDAKGNPVRDAQGRVMYTNTANDQARAAVAGPGIGQQIASNRLYNYAAPRQTQDASNIASDLAGRAVAAGQYNPLQAQSYLLNQPQQIRAAQINAERINADQIKADQIKAGRVGTGSFTAPGTADRYMSPYMQNVVQQQQREAQRQGDIAASNRTAQAIGAGAFGGSRQAIENAEANRNLATQLGDIEGQGLQQAFQNAQGQFNTEQGLGLQAQQANQNTGLTAQQANQQARLNAATQNQQARLNAATHNQQTGLQSQQANQNAGLTAQQSNQQANMQTAAQNQQALQKAQAESEASRQFGASLGLQGLNQASQNAALLGSMGQQQYGQDMGVIQAQNQMGAQQQAQQQALINQKMQNYATAQQYPMMQLGVMSNMLRGLPMQSTNTQMYQAQPSAFNQAAGMLGTGLSLAKDYKTLNSAKGGVIKMAPGGIATGVPAGKLSSDLEGPRFTDEILQKKANDPQTDQATKDLVSAEMARRSGLRSGAKGMAPGGIVAFKDKGAVEDKDDIKNEIEQDLIEKFKALSPVPDASRTTPPPPAPPVDIGGAGILEALKANPELLSAKAAPAPAPSLTEVAASAAAPTEPSSAVPLPPGTLTGATLATAQGKDPAGITAAVSKSEEPVIGGLSSRLPADLQTEMGLLGDQQKRYDELRKSTVPAQVERQRKERAALGLHSFYDEERESVKAKKLALKDQAKSDAEDRLHRFLITWGRTPGSTLKGIIEGGYDLSHQQELSKKEQRKMASELDGVMSHLNEAEYLRQIGEMDKAQEKIDKAGEQYYKLGVDKAKITADYNIKMMDQANKLEIAQLKAELAANKTGNKAAIIQQADEYFKGLVAEGKPANAITYKQALKEVNAMQPSVTSTAMTLPSRETGAGAAVTSAGAAAANAQTAAEKAEDERQDKINKAARQAKRTTVNRARLEAAESEDDKKGITAADPKSSVLKVEKDIRKEAEDKYGKKPAAAAEPKKEEKKGKSDSVAPPAGFKRD